MSTWIDFRELRSKLNFEQILRHFHVEVQRKGDQHHGFCPLPNHKGKRNSKSFSANLDRGIFNCFGCGAKGNLLDFACLMSKVDPRDGHALRAVAGELQDRFAPETRPAGNPPKKSEPKESERVQDKGLRVIVNAPLDFELKGLNLEHPYLLGRGFTKETIARFGLGFASRGSLKDRVAIPLLDHDAKLLGYAGRVVDDKAVTEDNPRYKFPGKRERDGQVFEFRKTLFLYNGFRITAPVDDLVVVEGFPSVWWFDQCGRPNTVATMGADCSDRQAELIVSLVKPSGHVWIVPDDDPAGGRFSEALLLKLSPHRFVRWGSLPQRLPCGRLA